MALGKGAGVPGGELTPLLAVVVGPSTRLARSVYKFRHMTEAGRGVAHPLRRDGEGSVWGGLDVPTTSSGPHLEPKPIEQK